MADSAVWSPLERDYQAERNATALQRQTTSIHPLLEAASGADAEKQSAGAAQAAGTGGAAIAAAPEGPAASVPDDPLSMMMGGPEELDPLTLLAQQADAEPEAPAQPQNASGSAGVDEYEDPSQSPGQAMLDMWQREKEAILDRFTLTGKIKLATGLLKAGGEKAVAEAPRSVKLDRTKMRLVELEEAEEEEDASELSQKEFTANINRLHDEISYAWRHNERVTALKRTIQCAKMLRDTRVPAFYPSVFVLVTDILDSFGALVFDRLCEKAAEAEEQVQSGASKQAIERWRRSLASKEIPEEARETARNWFYKVACIRELVPRVFVELALLRCYQFVREGAEVSHLKRLSGAIRGIGDPLVASYARTYLLRCGARVAKPETFVDVSEQGFDDFVTTFDSFKERQLTRGSYTRGLSADEYCALLGPALNWMGHFVSVNASRDKYAMLLGQFRDNCGVTVALRPLVVGFPPHLVAAFATRIVSMAKESEALGCAKCDVFVSLGDKLLQHPPPQEQRLGVLNETWKVVRQEQDLPTYTRAAVSYIRLLLRHYSDREVLILLKDLAKHLRHQHDQVHTVIELLGEVIDAVVDSRRGAFSPIVSSEYFLSVLDAFTSDRKTSRCKQLLAWFSEQPGCTGDAALIHTMFEIARNLHDSIDSLSFDDERRQISRLLCNFVDKIDFGRDLEKQLNVLVDCRASFSNLDAVNERLVLATCALIAKAHRLVRGQHTRKTAAFVKACLAYCHITVPSIDDPFRRLHLFLLCTQVALVNQCLPQADTCLKQAVAMIPDIAATHDAMTVQERRETEETLLAFLGSLASTMVVAPGHPEHGALYLVKGLVKALQAYPWQEDGTGKARAFLHLLPLLTSLSQPTLAYHIDKVESNDTLYGGSAEFRAEVETYISRVIEIVLGIISEGVKQHKGSSWREGIDVALLLLNQMVVLLKMGNKRAGTVASQLIKVSADLIEAGADARHRAWYESTTRLLSRLAQSGPGIQRSGSRAPLTDSAASLTVYKKLAQAMVERAKAQ